MKLILIFAGFVFAFWLGYQYAVNQPRYTVDEVKMLDRDWVKYGPPWEREHCDPKDADFTCERVK